MQLKDVYSKNFINSINQLFDRIIIDPQLKFDDAIPVEIFIQNLGYQIQLNNQMQPMTINNQTHIIKLRSKMPVGKQRFYLGQAFGKIVYANQTKAFLNQ